jgi:hypothetical protein
LRSEFADQWGSGTTLTSAEIRQIVSKSKGGWPKAIFRDPKAISVTYPTTAKISWRISPTSLVMTCVTRTSLASNQKQQTTNLWQQGKHDEAEHRKVFRPRSHYAARDPR